MACARRYWKSAQSTSSRIWLAASTVGTMSHSSPRISSMRLSMHMGRNEDMSARARNVANDVRRSPSEPGGFGIFQVEGYAKRRGWARSRPSGASSIGEGRIGSPGPNVPLVKSSGGRASEVGSLGDHVPYAFWLAPPPTMPMPSARTSCARAAEFTRRASIAARRAIALGLDILRRRRPRKIHFPHHEDKLFGFGGSDNLRLLGFGGGSCLRQIFAILHDLVLGEFHEVRLERPGKLDGILGRHAPVDEPMIVRADRVSEANAPRSIDLIGTGLHARIEFVRH